MIITTIKIICIILAIVLIVLVILQQGKGSDLGSAFGGGSSNSMFGAVGPSNFLGKLTAFIAALFLILNLAQAMLAGSIRMVLSQQLLKKKGGGRIGAFEVMTGTLAVRNLIREGKMASVTSTLQTSAKDGMITMEKYVEGLKQKGLID